MSVLESFNNFKLLVSDLYGFKACLNLDIASLPNDISKDIAYHIHQDGVYLGTLMNRDGVSIRNKFWERLRNVEVNDESCSIKLRNFAADVESGALKCVVQDSSDTPTIVDGVMLTFDPPRLMSWDIDTIPEVFEVAGYKVKMRDTIMRRVSSECPIVCVHHPDRIAYVLANWDSPHWIRYAEYCRKHNGRFSIDYVRRGALVLEETNKDVLSGVRFSMTLICEVFNRVLPLTAVDKSILDEAHAFMMKEPIINTAIYKAIITPFINVTSCETMEGRGCDWHNIDYSDRHFKGTHFSPFNVNRIDLKHRYTNIDRDGQNESLLLANEHELVKLARFLKHSTTMSFTPRNCITTAVIRCANSLTGYVGSDFAASIITQIDAYKDFPRPTEDALTSIRETFSRVVSTCLAHEDIGQPTSRENRLSRATQFLTSRSAGTPDLKPIIFQKKMHSLVYSLADGRFIHRDYLPRVSAKTKRSVFLTECNHIMTRKAILEDKLNPAYLGSRLVPGGRPIRIIFPIALPRYLVMQFAAEPVSNALLQKTYGPSEDILSKSGIGLEFGAPHMTLAHPMGASSRGNVAILCTDYSSFDASQIGVVGQAECCGFKDGIRQANLKTFSSYISSESWMNDTYYELADIAYPDEGNTLYFKFKNPIGNKTHDVIIKTDMLTSGVPHTAAFNTMRNLALHDDAKRIMSITFESNIKTLMTNVIGDDSLSLHTSSNLPAYQICEGLLAASLKAAENGHAKASSKRSLVSTVSGEHIKIGFRYGCVQPNLQMPFIFSEKSSGLNLTPFQRIKQVRDNLNTGSCRLVDPDLILNFLYALSPVLNEVTSPELIFVLGPGTLFCTRGACIHPDCPILPRGFRLLLDDKFNRTMNGLYNRMDKLMDSPNESRELALSASDAVKITPEALGVNVPTDAKPGPYPAIVEECSASNAVKSMMVRSMKDAAGVVLTQFGRNRLIKTIMTERLSLFDSDEFYPYRITNIPIIPKDLATPYITVTAKLKRTLTTIGHAYNNIFLSDPTSRLDGYIRRHRSQCPAHLGGETIITILRETPTRLWEDALYYCGFSRGAAYDIAKLAPALLHSIEMYDDCLLGYYGGPIQYIDLSLSRLNELVSVQHAAPKLKGDRLLFGAMVSILQAYNNTGSGVFQVEMLDKM
uniref:RdRp n=1 Tax=Wenling reo-like virus 2 TaxID=1923539 RepID=A0A1L3KPG2_9VIRU|nr:RdRp [Wenling reo-like virus 2]